MTRRLAPDHSRLFGMASEQGGYFTAAQARECGISQPLPSHHSRAAALLDPVLRGRASRRRDAAKDRWV